jgi:phosphoglycerate dehydrogenase-like enzyme
MAPRGFASRGTPLHERQNLFLTPRLGAHTREARLRASWYVAHRMHETLTAPAFRPGRHADGLMDLEGGRNAAAGWPQP